MKQSRISGPSRQCARSHSRELHSAERARAKIREIPRPAKIEKRKKDLILIDTNVINRNCVMIMRNCASIRQV